MQELQYTRPRIHTRYLRAIQAYLLPSHFGTRNVVQFKSFVQIVCSSFFLSHNSKWLFAQGLQFGLCVSGLYVFNCYLILQFYIGPV